MKRAVLLIIALAMIVAACASVEAPAVNSTTTTDQIISTLVPDVVVEPTTTSTTTTTTTEPPEEAAVLVEPHACTGIEGVVDVAEHAAMRARLEEIIDESNEELYATTINFGLLYVPFQELTNDENYFPLTFSDMVDCAHMIVVVTITSTGVVYGSDWRWTWERWARAVFELSTRIAEDPLFVDLEQIGVRTFWAADASIMDGILDMADVRPVPRPGAIAEIYAQMLQRNVWTMDLIRRNPR